MQMGIVIITLMQKNLAVGLNQSVSLRGSEGGVGNKRKKAQTEVWAFLIWSGKRGSNSRPQPWQGCALPTELFPHLSVACFTNTAACFQVFN